MHILYVHIHYTLICLIAVMLSTNIEKGTMYQCTSLFLIWTEHIIAVCNAANDPLDSPRKFLIRRLDDPLQSLLWINHGTNASAEELRKSAGRRNLIPGRASRANSRSQDPTGNLRNTPGTTGSPKMVEILTSLQEYHDSLRIGDKLVEYYFFGADGR